MQVGGSIPPPTAIFPDNASHSVQVGSSLRALGALAICPGVPSLAAIRVTLDVTPAAELRPKGRNSLYQVFEDS
jgi:hypothetical protein